MSLYLNVSVVEAVRTRNVFSRAVSDDETVV